MLQKVILWRNMFFSMTCPVEILIPSTPPGASPPVAPKDHLSAAGLIFGAPAVGQHFSAQVAGSILSAPGMREEEDKARAGRGRRQQQRQRQGQQQKQQQQQQEQPQPQPQPANQ